MAIRYHIGDVDTQESQAVSEAVCDLFRLIFPGITSTYISQLFQEVEQMFMGQYLDYQAIDTSYHDLEHTLQATLCFVRLITMRQLSGTQPQITHDHFRIGLHAILMHDVGYLKKADDHEGTGAKFTFIHERRSCELATRFLSEKAWPQSKIEDVCHLISCTGPRSSILSIPFHGPIEAMLGKAVCTADYLGQMSDPGYVAKLPVLFDEFQESDDYRGVPKEERLFKSMDDLLRGTPYFWNKVVLPKLDKNCDGLYRHLTLSTQPQINPYLIKIEENIEAIRQLAAEIPTSRRAG